MGKDSKKYFCIFGGGAIRGLVYIGVLKVLRERNIEITGYAGASAGSIAAVMTALNYTNEEMAEAFNIIDYKLFRDLNFSFKIELALSKGEVFTDKIREMIGQKLGTDKPVTFKDFPKNLYILTSNLTTGECVVFSKETTPDFEVAQAVRISSGFPGLMNPVDLNGEYYVDGDLAKPCALSQVSPLLNPEGEKILEFRIEGAKKQPLPTNPLSFLNNGIDFLNNISTDNAIRTFAHKEKYDYIIFPTENVLLFDFNISKEQREYLIKLGYDTTNNFFENILPKKEKEIKILYMEMKNVLEKCFDNLVKRKYDDAKEIIFSYISKRYKIFERLDERAVDKLNEVAQMLDDDVKKVFFLIPSLQNHGEVKKNISDLLSALEEKIN
ncbi:patatin-like phospholipase family protein [bacterium]|nr:patatin-like phospholipase family protein [bacterium]